MMNKKIIYIAGGCFWGIEAYFQRIKGINKTEVYYLNGKTKNPSYKDVCNSSGHVEAVKLEYDINIISNKEIWDLFINLINPYSLNKQGNDKGIQYRTGIYSNDNQLLEEFKKFNNDYEKLNNKKTVIEFENIYDETRAEEYHQKYLDKNPNGYCHINLHNIDKKYLK